MKNLQLKKEHIQSIKYFIKWEEDKHKYGKLDKFKISNVKIHADGYYSFELNWYLRDYDTEHGRQHYEGNLFEEFPISSVYDGCDCIELLFQPIHIQAYERIINNVSSKIEDVREDRKYLMEIYKEGGALNKENKKIKEL